MSDEQLRNGAILHWGVEQGTPEWFELRRGRLTASDASKIITPTGRPSSSFNDAVSRVVAERLGYEAIDPFPRVTEWMERGVELEPDARDWLAFVSDLDLLEIGFVSNGVLGASPDGVYKDGEDYIPCEFKCPKASTHIKWLVNGELPPEHKAQVHMQMILLNSPFARFMSYHPDMRSFEIVVEADDFTEALHDRLDAFVEAVSKTMEKLK